MSRKTNSLPDDNSEQDHDQGQRRGKRPRTSKPVFKRPAESVISVSPGDLKSTGSPGGEERREPPRTFNKPDERPDLFRQQEPASQEKRVPSWRQDRRRITGWTEPPIFPKPKEIFPEKTVREPVIEPLEETQGRIMNGDHSVSITNLRRHFLPKKEFLKFPLLRKP